MNHPTSTGVLRVFEPRYLSMLAQHSRFVHVLSRDVVAVIPELARDCLGGGLPCVGVLVHVQSVREDGQAKLVAYEGVRRVRLLMLEEAEPFAVRGLIAPKTLHAASMCQSSCMRDRPCEALPCQALLHHGRTPPGHPACLPYMHGILPMNTLSYHALQVAAVEPLDDDDEGRLAVSQPEQEVYTALQEVLHLLPPTRHHPPRLHVHPRVRPGVLLNHGAITGV